ncbi:MAG: hypothetical protein AAB588_02875 [Patescibacteria group bacterium]
MQFCSSPICNNPGGVQFCTNGSYGSCSAVDRDRDNDGILDCHDYCPDTYEPTNQNANGGDTPGDVCEAVMQNMSCRNTTLNQFPTIRLRDVSGNVVDIFLNNCGNIAITDTYTSRFFQYIPPNLANRTDAAKAIFNSSWGARVTACVGPTDWDAETLRQSGSCRDYTIPTPQ